MYRSIVMVKQVPDTANISGKVMKEDGTVNRAKLPAIFNHEDKEALEMALQVKEKFGGTVSVITMGPPRASDMLKECLYMGADNAYLISDRKFAGSDTLATSYVLSEAIKSLGEFDFVFAGRQAIDGDTAQVGPQTAEKLGLPQITYAEEILELKDKTVRIRRAIDGGFEILEGKLPLLITVVKGANQPRPFSSKRVMIYKNAKTLLDLQKLCDENSLLYLDELLFEYKNKNMYISTITADDLKELDTSRLGLHGSPTKVHKVESVVLSGGEFSKIDPSRDGISKLIDELLNDHILG
ncbi:MAG: electron transfer flavoprotein subunit beta/FixA family protein [Ignavibacteriaceae bacterium]|nr:electron transfer flavoprotein subunit beta/FixA family protein [Ignavibacteriaceae bacterium]